MTLRRSNPNHARSVIDRTDDSIHHVRVGVIGRPGLFLDSLIEALRGAGFTTWWAGAASPTGGLIDRLASKRTDLVLFDVGTAAPTQTELSLIGQLTDRGGAGRCHRRRRRPARPRRVHDGRCRVGHRSMDRRLRRAGFRDADGLLPPKPAWSAGHEAQARFCPNHQF